MITRFENITVYFKDECAISDVSLTLKSGSISALVGPNGSGKSTLLNVLLGLIRPNKGQILVNEQVVANSKRCTSLELRSRIGYLPEAVAFSENLTGLQVLRFFGNAHGVARGRVTDILKKVGLLGASKRSVRGYSRGMKQRLGLGISILHEPELLVLDEPTGGLDQMGLGVLWEILSEWSEAGRTVVMSTHELSLIEQRTNKLFVLVDGMLAAQGSPSELRTMSGLKETMRAGPGLDEVYDAIVKNANQLKPRLAFGGKL
jgi:Cu-processing system ATP-binding protein